MDIKFFLRHVFLKRAQQPMKRTDIVVYSDSELAYLIKFKNESDVRNEYVKYVAKAVLKDRKESIEDLKQILESLMTMMNCDNYIDLLEPLFIEYEPKLSEILSISHVFCNDCNLYVPSSINSWIVNNREIFDSEILFYSYLLDRFQEYIKIDSPSYSHTALFSDAIDERRLSGQTDCEKLKQLYTVILYADDIADDL